MLSKYGFKKQYLKNSFQDCCSSNVIYFPINDSSEFPSVIRDKTEELIDMMINTYKNEKGCILDLSELCLEARMNVYFDREIIPLHNISIFIYDDDGILQLEQKMQVTRKNILYEPMKNYFLCQIGKALF